MTPTRRDRTLDAEAVETLLAHDQPGLFAAIADLDWYSRSHRDWIDGLEIRAGSKVLEIGCATGALTAYLVDNGCTATGLDRSEDMISRARKDHPRLDLRVGDATMLPYDDDSFDVVVAASVINVVPDAEKVLSEMHRVCAPGGTVSVLVPSSEFSNRDLDALIRMLGLTRFSQAAVTKWHGGPPKMSRPQLEALFQSVDLELDAAPTYLEGMLIAATATAR